MIYLLFFEKIVSSSKIIGFIDTEVLDHNNAKASLVLQQTQSSSNGGSSTWDSDISASLTKNNKGAWIISDIQQSNIRDNP